MLSHRYLEYAQEAGHFQITPAIYPESITVPASLALSELVFVSTISCASLSPRRMPSRPPLRHSKLENGKVASDGIARFGMIDRGFGSFRLRVYRQRVAEWEGGVRRSYSNCGLRQISNHFHVVYRSRLRQPFRLKVGGVTQEGGVRKSFSKFYLRQISHRFHVTSIMTSVALGCGFTVTVIGGAQGDGVWKKLYLPSNCSLKQDNS